MSSIVPKTGFRLETPTSPFRLAPGLAAPGALPVADAARLVFADWDRQADEGHVMPESMAKSVQLVHRFAQFTDARGVRELRDIDQDLCERWLAAKHGVGVKTGQRPTPRAMKTRRSALSQLFTTSYVLGLWNENPAAFVTLPEVGTRPARALTEAEADACRSASRRRVRETRLPAVVALALTGAGSSEIAHAIVADIDLDAATVWVHSGGRHRVPRLLSLDAWAAKALAARVTALAKTHSPDELPGVRIAYTGAATGYTAQSAIGMALGNILASAKLTSSDLRTTSFAMYAAHRAWRDTRRVENAAAVLGVRSLDTAARMCGYDWADLYYPALDIDGDA